MDPRVVAAEWAWALPFFLACTVPGAGALALLLRARRAVELNAAEFGALAFAITVALISVVATVAWLAGGSLAVVSVAWALFVAGGVALLVRCGPGLRGRIDGGWSGLAIACGAALVSMFQRPWFFTSSDIFYHVAAVRSLVRSGQVLATDPIYGTATRVIDPTSGIWHSVQAAFAAPLGIEPSTLFLSAMGMGAFALVASIWALHAARDRRRSCGRRLDAAAAHRQREKRSAGVGVSQRDHLRTRPAVRLPARSRVRAPRRGVYVAGAGVVGFATVTMHLGGAEFVGLLGAVLCFWVLVVAWLSRAGEEPLPARAALYPLVALAVAFVPALPVLLPRLMALRGSSVIGDVARGADRHRHRASARRAADHDAGRTGWATRGCSGSAWPCACGRSCARAGAAGRRSS